MAASGYLRINSALLVIAVGVLCLVIAARNKTSEGTTSAFPCKLFRQSSIKHISLVMYGILVSISGIKINKMKVFVDFALCVWLYMYVYE